MCDSNRLAFLPFQPTNHFYLLTFKLTNYETKKRYVPGGHEKEKPSEILKERKEGNMSQIKFHNSAGEEIAFKLDAEARDALQELTEFTELNAKKRSLFELMRGIAETLMVIQTISITENLVDVYISADISSGAYIVQLFFQFLQGIIPMT